MRYLFILIFTAFIALNAKADFTVSAEVTRSTTINSDLNTVSQYFKNLNIYQKNFPGIVSVQNLGGGESKWVYEIDAPLASPVQMPFIITEKVSSEDYVVYESKSGSQDFFRCSARLVSIGENQTKLSITIKIKMVRESGSDVHFMAPILGEKFISKEMKKDLNEALGTFLSRCKKELK